MRVLLLLLLLLLLFLTTRPVHSKPDPQYPFFTRCPPASCGSGSLQIRFPLRLRSSPPSCSPKSLDLTCRNNDAFLSSFRVTSINYLRSLLTVDIGSGSPCPFRNPTRLSTLFPPAYTPLFITNITLITCSNQFTPGPGNVQIAGPIACLSGSGSYVYAVDWSESMDAIPGDCMVVGTGGEIPYAVDSDYAPEYNGYKFGDVVDAFVRRREVTISWIYFIREISGECEKCEGDGRFCGFHEETNEAFCQKSSNHGTLIKSIIGASVGGVFIIVSAFLAFIYISRISIKEKETRLKVERFLATYKSTKPTRYTYSEIKKITRKFRHKLGQGGFGSVYKGELPNGVPVAVKMLEKSKGDGEEFINEVATIGRIHHANVVRLLGFCSEGTRHALLYEFMPNESLEKFIFSRESKRHEHPFSMEKLQDIAIGIARGIEYLHQGCDQRILHFDIKPHNILLDQNFSPKISDFGLAKLCSRDHSMVTMTAARGTMGYIAPEIYSRNFGAVSYKSDVYSFGMLLMEMVTGKRNADPAIGNQTPEVYFPEQLYERLVNGSDLGLNASEEEEDIAKKLVIVAFWCIQWSPMNRPSMTRVVQLLMGNMDILQIPPKPFAASSCSR